MGVTLKPKDYNKINWSDYFEYSENSPSFLVWKAPRYFKGTPNFDRVGKPVGSLLKNSKKHTHYWVVGLGKEGKTDTYLIHRIIWVLLKGSVDINSDIDHIDGNGVNNRIDNLREVPKGINARNRRKGRNNKTGVIGVCLYYNKDGIQTGYQATIKADKKQVSKYFSFAMYNDALAAACEWRKRMVEDYNKKGAQFSERHGC